jgi:predicted cobalt transporter CbtA
MPQNSDPIKIPMELVDGFRTISAVTMTISWIVNALILGWLWKKFQPDSVTTRT